MDEETTQTETETKVETNTETTEQKTETKPERSVLTLKKATTEGEDKTETTTETKAEKFDPATFKMPDKYKGKTAEEIAFSTMQLEKKLGEKAQAATVVPETYVFDALKDHGLNIVDEAHGAEVTAMLKDLGLSQEQLTKALPHWRKEQERTAKAAAQAGYEKAIREEFGGLPDLPAAEAQLRKAWGTDFESNYKIVLDYYQKNPDFFDKPGKWHAQGYEIGLALAKQELGADFITGHDSAGAADPTELRAELQAITSNPRYGKPGAEGAALEKKADDISKRIAAMRK